MSFAVVVHATIAVQGSKVIDNKIKENRKKKSNFFKSTTGYDLQEYKLLIAADHDEQSLVDSISDINCLK